MSSLRLALKQSLQESGCNTSSLDGSNCPRRQKLKKATTTVVATAKATNATSSTNAALTMSPACELSEAAQPDGEQLQKTHQLPPPQEGEGSTMALVSLPSSRKRGRPRSKQQPFSSSGSGDAACPTPDNACADAGSSPLLASSTSSLSSAEADVGVSPAAKLDGVVEIKDASRAIASTQMPQPYLTTDVSSTSLSPSTAKAMETADGYDGHKETSSGSHRGYSSEDCSIDEDEAAMTTTGDDDDAEDDDEEEDDDVVGPAGEDSSTETWMGTERRRRRQLTKRRHLSSSPGGPLPTKVATQGSSEYHSGRSKRENEAGSERKIPSLDVVERSHEAANTIQSHWKKKRHGNASASKENGGIFHDAVFFRACEPPSDPCSNTTLVSSRPPHVDAPTAFRAVSEGVIDETRQTDTTQADDGLKKLQSVACEAAPSCTRKKTIDKLTLNTNSEAKGDATGTPTETAGGDGATTKAESVPTNHNQPKPVPAPSPDLLEWVRGLPLKRARRNVMPGLRVKVRFATKVKRDGKVLKKKKWFGGRVSAVSKEGSKIRIKYDDGTSEITKFPDKDIVVDCGNNGVHEPEALSSASRFTPQQRGMAKTAGEVATLSSSKVTKQGVAFGVNVLADKKDPSEGKDSASQDTSRSANVAVGSCEMLTDLSASKNAKACRRVADTEDSISQQNDDAELAERSTEGGGSKDNDHAESVVVKRKRGRPPKHRALEEQGVPDSATKQLHYGGKGEDVASPSQSRSDDPAFANSDQVFSAAPEASGREDIAVDPDNLVASDQAGGDVEDNLKKANLTIRIPCIRKDDCAKGKLLKQHASGREKSVRRIENKGGFCREKDVDTQALSRKGKNALDYESHEPHAKGLHAHGGVTSKQASCSQQLSENETGLGENGGDHEDQMQPASGQTLTNSPRSPRLRKSKRKRSDAEEDEQSLLLGNGMPSLPDLDHQATAPVNPEGGSNLLGSRNSAFEKQGQRINNVSSGDMSSVAEEGKLCTPLCRSKPDSSVVRPGRRAGREAKERIASKQEVVIHGPSTKKQKGKKKGEKRKDGGEGDESESSEEDSQWVQCDGCRKWRIIPSSVVASLPTQWFCSDNIYDPKRASCEVPEQTPQQVAKEKKRMKKRQKLMDTAASEIQERKEGRSESAKEKPVERSRSPRPGCDNDSKSKRPSPVEQVVDSVGEHQQRRLTASVGKKSRSAEALDAPPSHDHGLDNRKGRGRPRRTGNLKEMEQPITSTPQQAGGEVDNLEWVQCEKCDKWRKLPPHISADELPDVWFCAMNTWNTASASCSAPEDKADGLQDIGIFGNSGVGTGKLSYRTLIFGNTGRRNRPVSERTRAAESLFAVPSDEDDSPPAVMYANSSAFVSRSKANNTSTENDGISFFDFMSQSTLWSQLRGSAHLSNTRSAGFDDYLSKPRANYHTYETLPHDVKQPVKALVAHVLGTQTLSGDDVHLETQRMEVDECPAGCERARSYCSVNVVVTALCDMVREGKAECVQNMGADWSMRGWDPLYRMVIPKSPSLVVQLDSSIEARKESRCMKIAKPWKKARIQQ